MSIARGYGRRYWTIGAAASLLLAVSASCGGSSKPSTTATTVNNTTTTSVGPTTTTVSADQAKAMAALLTLSDVPAGWTASADNNTSGSLGGQQGTSEIATCLGVSAASFDTSPPTADSPTFTSADQADTLDDETQVFSSSAAAAKDFSLFSSPKTPGCMTQLFNGPLKASFTSGLQPGQSLAGVSSAAKPFPKLGDHSGEVEITFVIAQSGLKINVLLDLIVVVKGRSETTLTLTQPQILAMPALAKQLATVVAGRMTA